MTTENPWLTGGSDSEPTDTERDPFRSLGLEFTEESPAIIVPPTENSTNLDAVAPLTSEISVMATTVFAPGPQPGLDLVALPPAASTELVATSRRARRDAERGTPGPGRASRDQSSPRRTGPRGVRRASAPATTAMAAAAAPARPASRVPIGRRIAQKAFPPVVMLAVASLIVGTSVPANALFDPEAPPASLALSSLPAATTTAAGVEAVALEDQVLEAEVADELAATAASRDEWGVTSYAEMLRLKYGSRNYSYTTSGTGAVRWPFPYAATILSAFGDRVAPCRGCSSYHRGIDMDGGAGNPIGAIADGVVTYVGYGGGWGYRVEIEHVVNGQKVTSLYAHMVEESSVLQVGDTVAVGDVVGAVGNSGLSTGPHLHLEIRIDDVPIDPFAWLTANAS